MQVEFRPATEGVADVPPIYGKQSQDTPSMVRTSGFVATTPMVGMV